MEIIRAGLNDTDVFDRRKLDFGGCCFFTEDKLNRYFFEINGCQATLYANTDCYIKEAIEEFLFYSGFISIVNDENGRTLITRPQSTAYLCEISAIQPSQFYISEAKLASCKTWVRSREDIFVPVVINDGKHISLDGHTRMRAALDLGYTSVYVYEEEYDETMFHFVDEAVRRQIYSVSDMEVVSGEEYECKWNRFCDDLFARLE